MKAKENEDPVKSQRQGQFWKINQNEGKKTKLPLGSITKDTHQGPSPNQGPIVQAQLLFRHPPHPNYRL